MCSLYPCHKVLSQFLRCFQIDIYCNIFSHFVLYATLNSVFTKNRVIYLVFLPSKSKEFPSNFSLFPPLVYYACCVIAQFNDSPNMILLCTTLTAFSFALGVVGDSFNLGSKCLLAEF